jgi:hypothetical protein
MIVSITEKKHRSFLARVLPCPAFFFHKLMPCCHAAMVVAVVLASHGHGFLSVEYWMSARYLTLLVLHAACNPMFRQIARHCWGLGGR